MRMPRLKVLGQSAYYHCMSRVVGGASLLGRREKEVMRNQMRKMAAFCGISIITYSIMDNHFHVFVRSPGKPPDLSDAELLERVGILYNQDRVAAVRAMLKTDRREAVRAQYLSRMGDFSVFMKELKQRFTIWYNKQHGRFGTLWAERFKSVLVQGRPEALLTVAAYIDLNPVRAGICSDPMAYRYCGYGEALGRPGSARAGLVELFDGISWTAASRQYRMILFGKGYFAKSGGRPGIDPKKVLEVLSNGGKLSLEEVLRCRVRYFSDGLVLGSREYVEGFHAQMKNIGSGHRKKSHQMHGAEWQDLAVMRKLRGTVFG